MDNEEKRYIKLLMAHGIPRDDARTAARNVQYYNEMYARENHRLKRTGNTNRKVIIATYQFRWDVLQFACNLFGGVHCRTNIRKEINYAEKTD